MQFKVASWLKQPVGYARTFELNDDLSRLADGLEPTRPLTGRVELMRIHSGVLVTGACRTALKVPCSRCLEPLEHPVEFPLEEIFRPLTDVHSGRFLRPEEYEGTPETMFDAALLINERYELDLSEVVRQHLWIAASQYPACQYAEPEACPAFRESRRYLALANGAGPAQAEAVDPRWAALLPLAEGRRENGAT